MASVASFQDQGQVLEGGGGGAQQQREPPPSPSTVIMDCFVLRDRCCAVICSIPTPIFRNLSLLQVLLVSQPLFSTHQHPWVQVEIGSASSSTPSTPMQSKWIHEDMYVPCTGCWDTLEINGSSGSSIGTKP